MCVYALEDVLASSHLFTTGVYICLHVLARVYYWCLPMFRFVYVCLLLVFTYIYMCTRVYYSKDVLAQALQDVLGRRDLRVQHLPVSKETIWCQKRPI